MSTFPVSHKTVFVLDTSSYFSQSSNQPIEYDVLRSKGSGVIPAAPITKSLWTCNVEGLQEYLRVALDIYPREKQVRVIAGNNILTSWDCPDPIASVLMKLAVLGPPKAKKDDAEYGLHHGLSSAIECLREPTDRQRAVLNQRGVVKNRGRIICLTAVNSDSHIRQLEEYVLDSLQQHNKMEGASDMLPLDHCELVIVHAVPVGTESRIADRPCTEINPFLSCEVASTPSGRHVYNKLVWLCCKHYDLTSTTVTGIPMKEEQNASSSANYDVELLHPAGAHDDMFRNEHAEGLVIPSKEGLPIETAPLKWCTPKSSVIELQNCSTAYRICPVDVNSRHSSCLTNFLLSGRAVLLEQPRKSGNKVISHMLAAHGGEIFIHSIPTSRSILEDPPSISEGCGGRVTDYRITAFGEFMKENRLAPVPVSDDDDAPKPYTRALSYIERSSRVWPMVISDTIVFNIVNMSPLPQLIIKPSLTADDVLSCKKVILKVVAMEAKNESLPLPASGARGKGPKRDEQYRQLWVELETLIRAYVDTSPEHAEVLECLMVSKRPTTEDSSGQNGRKAAAKEAKEAKTAEVDQAWKDLDRMQQMSEREKQDFLKGEKASVEASPPKKLKSEDLLMRSGGQTLLSMWNNRLKTIQAKRTHELDGRMDSDADNKTRLYIHLDDNEEQDSIPPTSQAAMINSSTRK